jgi:hypothetical protein
VNATSLRGRSTAGFRVGHHFLEIIYLQVVEFCPHHHPRTGFNLGEFNRLEIKKSGTARLTTTIK